MLHYMFRTPLSALNHLCSDYVLYYIFRHPLELPTAHPSLLLVKSFTVLSATHCCNIFRALRWFSFAREVNCVLLNAILQPIDYVISSRDRVVC